MTTNSVYTNQNEKRMYERYRCEARINRSYFNKNRSYRATLLNVGRNGVYFETDKEIEPNTTILLRLEAILGDHRLLSEKNCLRTIALADVKWSKKISNENSVYYGAGARYCGIK